MNKCEPGNSSNARTGRHQPICAHLQVGEIHEKAERTAKILGKTWRHASDKYYLRWGVRYVRPRNPGANQRSRMVSAVCGGKPLSMRRWRKNTNDFIVGPGGECIAPFGIRWLSQTIPPDIDKETLREKGMKQSKNWSKVKPMNQTPTRTIPFGTILASVSSLTHSARVRQGWYTKR